MDTTFLFANIIRTVRSFRGKTDVRGVRRKLKIFCARRPKGTLSHLIRRLYRPDRDCLNALGLRFRLGDEVAHFVADFAFCGNGRRHPSLFVGQERRALARRGILRYLRWSRSDRDVQGRQPGLHRQQNRSARDGAPPTSRNCFHDHCCRRMPSNELAKLFVCECGALMLTLSKVAMHARVPSASMHGLAFEYLLGSLLLIGLTSQCYAGRARLTVKAGNCCGINRGKYAAVATPSYVSCALPQNRYGPRQSEQAVLHDDNKRRSLTMSLLHHRHRAIRR